MTTVARLAVPPALTITKSSLSFRLSKFSEPEKVLLVAPEVEQARSELRMSTGDPSSR